MRTRADRTGAVETSRRTMFTLLPNKYGTWRIAGYPAAGPGIVHVALVLGEIGDGHELLTRIHSECLTGEAFGSRRCDCGPQLEAAMEAIAKAGRGAILYLRGHEGRGIGLLRKLSTYQIQDAGLDTVDANRELGLPVDARTYHDAVDILSDLGIRSVRILTNNPQKIRELEQNGIAVVDRVPLRTEPTDDNLRYLLAKRDRMGHLLPDLPDG